MNIHHFRFFCILSALCGGDDGLVSAKLNTYAGAEGGNGTVTCHLTQSGSTKFFCKEECKAEDILIKTDEVRAQSGRYSLEYRQESSGRGILSVTITHLTKSDSGRYSCGFGGNLVQHPYWSFEVRVLDAASLDVNSGFSLVLTEGESITLGCSETVYREQKFLCKNECNKQDDILIETDGTRGQSGRYRIEYIEAPVFGLVMTITQVTKSDTGLYRCGYGRALYSYLYVTQRISVINDGEAPTAMPPQLPEPTSGDLQRPSNINMTPTYAVPVFLVPLVVCLLVVVMLLAVVLLLLYKLKTNRSADGRNTECVTCKNRPPVSHEDQNLYQSLDPATVDQDQTYSTQHK